jgi:ribA/ribD-fused uncharacterized protein
MKLLVSGGRDFDDVEFIVTHLNRLHKARTITQLIHGAAKGVDTIAAFWADESGILPRPFPAEWVEYGRHRAGPIRNQQMLDEGRPDALFAFPGGSGTADMVERAEKVLPEVWQSQWTFFTKKCRDTGFCSNFKPGYGFHDDEGVWWDTSEHFYQAMKTPIPQERQYIRVAATAFQAKTRGDEVNIYQDWGARKIDTMRQAIKYKFAPGTEAARLLQCTGIGYLVEWAPWGDTFWGVDESHVGLNWLGRLLMERRDQL